MIGELYIFGLFVPSLLVWALLALALGIPLRRVLGSLGVYRRVWHPALFDLALFVILWGAVTALAPHLRAIIDPFL